MRLLYIDPHHYVVLKFCNRLDSLFLKLGLGLELSEVLGVIRFFFISNKLDLTFRAPNHCAKFHQDQIKIAVV